MQVAESLKSARYVNNSLGIVSFFNHSKLDNCLPFLPENLDKELNTLVGAIKSYGCHNILGLTLSSTFH